MMKVKNCPFCGAYGSDMDNHDDDCYLKMIQALFFSGENMPNENDPQSVLKWLDAWNKRTNDD